MLQLPKGISLQAGRRAVSEVNAHAVSDADAYYYTDAGPADCPHAPRRRSNGRATAAARCLIGMIDTRVDTAHEALAGQDIEVIQLAGGSGTSRADHGTAIAALLSGKRESDAPGLMPQAKLLVVDAFAVEGGVERADVVHLADALESLSRRGVRVVNLSFSGPPNAVLKQAIDKALGEGMILVAAAGNNGAGGGPAYPAAYPGVIAVTAVDSDLRIQNIRASRGDYVALAAPGVRIQDGCRWGRRDHAVGNIVRRALRDGRRGQPVVTSAALDATAVSQYLSTAARDLGRPGGTRFMAGACCKPLAYATGPAARRWRRSLAI